MIKSGISFLKTLTDGSPLYKFASFLVFAICFCAIAALYFGTLYPTASYLVFVLFMVCVAALLCLAKITFKELREEKRDIQTMAISPLPMPPSSSEVGHQVVKVRSPRTPKSKPVRSIESEK